LASRWMLYGPVLLLAGLVAGGGWYGWKEYQRRQLAAAEAAKPVPKPDVLAQTYTGKIRAVKLIAVPAPIDGTLEGVEVADGEEVYEGQLLATIQNSKVETEKQQAEEDLERAKAKVADLESQAIAARLESSRASADLQRARAEYDTASRAFERVKLLFQQGAAARKGYEKAAAEFEKAAAELKSIEETLAGADQRAKAIQTNVETARAALQEKTDDVEESDADLLLGQVKSPVTGLLISHKRNSGDEVTRDIADLFEIATDLTALEVAAEIPAATAAKLAPGGAAFVQIAEAGDSPLNGTIRLVRDGIAYVEFLSPSPAIRPGMTAQVRFLVK
jgi:multidrug resistance efflux pump